MKNAILSLATAALVWSGQLLAVSPFELQWMNHEVKGTMYKSADHRQGIFIIEAYFLNCPYCNDNAAKVNEMAEKFANEPRVQVLDVGIDKQDSQYATWIAKHRPNHPVLKDANRTLIKQLGTSGYPSTYVIDCHGKVVAKTSGAWDLNHELTILYAVEELLKLDDCQ